MKLCDVDLIPLHHPSGSSALAPHRTLLSASLLCTQHHVLFTGYLLSGCWLPVRTHSWVGGPSPDKGVPTNSDGEERVKIGRWEGERNVEERSMWVTCSTSVRCSIHTTICEPIKIISSELPIPGIIFNTDMYLKQTMQELMCFWINYTFPMCKTS